MKPRSASQLPTIARLRELFRYDANTGDVIRLTGCRTGEPITRSKPSGYLLAQVDGTDILAHRLAWALLYGSWPTDDIDHINGDRSDNRSLNLRMVTRGENNQNIHTARGAFGFMGVCKEKGRRMFTASIKANGIKRRLGSFKTAAEAGAAYLEAKRVLHPAWREKRKT